MACQHKIISLGKTNKFLFLILIGAALSLALPFVENQSQFFAEVNTHPVMYSMTYSIGLSLTFTLLIIFKIRNKRNNNNTRNSVGSIRSDIFPFNSVSPSKMESRKKKFLWILLVSGIDFTAYILFCIYWVTLSNYINTWGMSLFFMSLLSRFILQNKLYKHHYLSIVSVVICGFIYNLFMDIFNREKMEKSYVTYIMQLLVSCLVSLVNILYKYLMDRIYINSYEILFVEGLIELTLGIITLVITTSIGVIDNFFVFIDELNQKEIIIYISLILIQFLLYSVHIMIIDLFSPFHILLISIIKDFLLFFIYFNKENLGISLFLIIGIGICICMLMLLVFTEIIELNFLGLSTMTKKNIELRSQFDSSAIIVLDDETEKEVNFEGYVLDLDDEKDEKPEKAPGMNTELSSENL